MSSFITACFQKWKQLFESWNGFEFWAVDMFAAQVYWGNVNGNRQDDGDSDAGAGRRSP